MSASSTDFDAGIALITGLLLPHALTDQYLRAKLWRSFVNGWEQNIYSKINKKDGTL